MFVSLVGSQGDGYASTVPTRGLVQMRCPWLMNESSELYREQHRGVYPHLPSCTTYSVLDASAEDQLNSLRGKVAHGQLVTDGCQRIKHSVPVTAG